MSTASYNCPCCGGPLKFSGESGKLECTACGNNYEPEALEMMTPEESGDEITFANDAKRFDTGEAGMRAYLCKNCGAELMTEDTTTAAECPYCGSPTILPDRIEGGVKPEKVVPFVVTKEQAQKQFEDYFKGKKLLPNVFLNSRNRISEMRRLYIPYLLAFQLRRVCRHGVRRGKGAYGAKGRVGNHPHEALSCAPQRRHAL